jgi:hypothetical protein
VGAQDAYLSITISPDKTWARSVISDPFWLLKARLGVIARLKPFVSVWAATSDWGVDEKKKNGVMAAQHQPRAFCPRDWDSHIRLGADSSRWNTNGILPEGGRSAHQIDLGAWI